LQARLFDIALDEVKRFEWHTQLVRRYSTISLGSDWKDDDIVKVLVGLRSYINESRYQDGIVLSNLTMQCLFSSIRTLDALQAISRGIAKRSFHLPLLQALTDSADLLLEMIRNHNSVECRCLYVGKAWSR